MSDTLFIHEPASNDRGVRARGHDHRECAVLAERQTEGILVVGGRRRHSVGCNRPLKELL